LCEIAKLNVQFKLSGAESNAMCAAVM